MRRTANGWQRIGWDEAFDEVAQNLKRIQAKYGRNSIATYLGNPTVHNYGALLFAPGFLRSLRTRNKFSATSVDQLAHHLASYLMFGHQLLLPVPDLDRTKFFLILGANPAVSNGSMMTAPGMSRKLQEIRQRGGKVILIDPRYNETARLADRHLFIRPGTDVLLLLALLHVVFDEGLNAPGPLGFVYKRRGDSSQACGRVSAGKSGTDYRNRRGSNTPAGERVCFRRVGCLLWTNRSEHAGVRRRLSVVD